VTGKQPETLDEIDWKILELLSEDPRRPYSDISERLEQVGYELSSEGTRYRVKKILNTMSIFFMVHPTEQDWEVMIFLIKIEDDIGEDERAFERFFEEEFWFVSRGFGTYDLYAVSTVASTQDIERLITRVRSFDFIEDMSYLIETDRWVESSNYFPIRNRESQSD